MSILGNSRSGHSSLRPTPLYYDMPLEMTVPTALRLLLAVVVAAAALPTPAVHMPRTAPSASFATADDAADFFINSFSAVQAHAKAHASGVPARDAPRAAAEINGTSLRNATYYDAGTVGAGSSTWVATLRRAFNSSSGAVNSSLLPALPRAGGSDAGNKGGVGDEYVVYHVAPAVGQPGAAGGSGAGGSGAGGSGAGGSGAGGSGTARAGGRRLLGYSSPGGAWDVASPNSEYVKLDVRENDPMVALAPGLNLTAGTRVDKLYFDMTPLMAGDALVRPKYTFLTWVWDSAKGRMTVEAPSPGFKRYDLWLEALVSVGFMTTSDDTAPRVVSMAYARSDVTTVLTNVQLNLTLTNDMPSLSGMATGVVYTVRSAPTDVGAAASVLDDDDTHLRGMMVTIGTNYEPGVDVLRIDPAKQAALKPVCQWHAVNGTMTMNGYFTKAAYTAALRALQFSSKTDNPALPDRRLRVVLWDGRWQRSTDDLEDARLFTDLRLTSRDVRFVITLPKPACTEAGKAEEGRAQIMLLSKPTAPVLCSVSTSDSTEALVKPNFVVLTESNWNTMDSAISVIGQPDGLDDGNVQFQIEVAVMVTQDQDYAKVMPGLATLTNIDDPLNLVKFNATLAPDAQTGLACKTSEEGKTCSMTVTLSHWHSGYQAFTSIVVTITSRNPGEGKIVAPNGGGLLTYPSGVITFTKDNWQTPQIVDVKGTDDGKVDGDIQYNVSFSAVVYKAGIEAALPIQPYNAAPDIVLVNVDDDVPSIDTAWMNNEVCTKTSEQGDNCRFSVQLGAQPLSVVTVPLKLSASAANEGSIKEPMANPSGNYELIFDAQSWNVPQWVNVEGLDDSDPDGSKFYQLEVGPATSTDSNYANMAVPVSPLNFENEDNDVSQLEVRHLGVKLKSMVMWVDETGRSDPFTVHIPSTNIAPSSNVVIECVTGDATEGVVSPSALVFTPTNFNTPQAITITGVDDNEIDGTARFSVTLKMTSTDPNFGGPPNPPIIWAFYVNNYDDDGLDLTPRECNTTEAGGSCPIMMSLPSWRDNIYERVEVSINSSQPLEAESAVKTAVFVQSNWSDLANFTIQGQDDFVDDGPQYLQFNIKSKLFFNHHSGANGKGWKWTKPFQVLVRNDDDDYASVIVTQQGKITSEAGSQKAAFEVRITSEPVGILRLPITSLQPKEGLPSVPELAFNKDNWRTPVTVVVSGVDDNVDDDDQVYFIQIGPAITDELAYAGYKRKLNFTNLDDDVLGMTVDVVKKDSTEWGNKAQFRTMLESEPLNPVLFSVSSEDATEGTCEPSLFVLAGDNWREGVNIYCTGQSDTEDDNDMDYVVQIAQMITQDIKYRELPPERVTLTNLDEPANRVRVTAAPFESTTSEAGATSTISVTMCSKLNLAGQCLDTWHVGEREYEWVKVQVMSNDLAEGRVLGAVVKNGGSPTKELLFTADNHGETLSFDVQGQDDRVVDGNTRYNLTMRAWVKTKGVELLREVPSYKLTKHVFLNNLDNDVAGVAFSLAEETPEAVTSETGNFVKLKICLSSQPYHNVMFGARVTNTTGAKPRTVSKIVDGTQLLTFTATNWEQCQYVKVQGVDDTEADGDQQYEVFIGPSASLDPKYSGVSSNFTISNIDNDIASLEIRQDNKPIAGVADHVDETGRQRKITVRLPESPTSQVVVRVWSDDPETAEIDVTEFIFTEQNYMTKREILITGKDNNIRGCGPLKSFSTPAVDPVQKTLVKGEGTPRCSPQGHTKFEMHMYVTSLDDRYSDVRAIVTMYSYDDDVLDFTRETCETSELGNTCVIGVKMRFWGTNEYESFNAVAESLKMSEGVISPLSFQFNEQNYMVPQNMTITGVDDDVADGAQTFQIKFLSQLTYFHHSKKRPFAFYRNNNCDTSADCLAGVDDAGGQGSVDCTVGNCKKSVKTVFVSNTNLDNDVAGLIVQPMYTEKRVNTMVNQGNDTHPVMVSMSKMEKVLEPYATSENGTRSGWLQVKLNSEPLQKVYVYTDPTVWTPPVPKGGYPEGHLHSTGPVDSNEEVATLVIGQRVTVHSFLSSLQSTEAVVSNFIRNAEDTRHDSVELFMTAECLGKTAEQDIKNCMRTFAVRLFKTSDNVCQRSLERDCKDKNSVADQERCSKLYCFALRERKPLTFDASSWMRYQDVFVTGVDDYVYDYPKNWQIRVGPTISDDSTYKDMKFFLDGMNDDDDAIGLTVKVLANVTSEDGTFEGMMGMQLVSQPKDTVLFTVSTSKANEAATSPQILAFSPDNWNVDQAINVRGVDDPFKDVNFPPDGTVPYQVNIKTLFTKDPDYHKAMLTATGDFHNLDDASDRDPSECQLGWYGSETERSCAPCPFGRFGDTTRNAKTLTACKLCTEGTKGIMSGGTSLWTACKACPEGRYTDKKGRLDCSQCRIGKFCYLASAGGIDINATDALSLPQGVQHHWTMQRQKILRTQWNVTSSMSLEINEQSLQVVFFAIAGAITFMAVMFICCVCSCVKMQLVDKEYWLRTKNTFRGFDQFDDDHSKVKKASIASDDKRTLMGGIFTLFFFGLTWSLLGVTMYLYWEFNEMIVQALVPKTATTHLRSTLKTQIDFVGFTGGQCPPKIKVRGTGIVGVEEKSLVCGVSHLQVQWTCTDCQLLSPNLMIEIDGGPTSMPEYVVSAAAIKWRLTADKVTPDEVNSVNGTIVPLLPGRQLFRGSTPTSSTVALIPARYENSLNTLKMSGYRVQSMQYDLGTVVGKDDYMSSAIDNKVIFMLKMTSSPVQLDTLVTPKLTWLDVWAQAGGLFGAVGAGVIFMMLGAEFLIFRVFNLGKTAVDTAWDPNAGRGKDGKDGKDKLGKKKGKGGGYDDDELMKKKGGKKGQMSLMDYPEFQGKSAADLGYDPKKKGLMHLSPEEMGSQPSNPMGQLDEAARRAALDAFKEKELAKLKMRRGSRMVVAAYKKSGENINTLLKNEAGEDEDEKSGASEAEEKPRKTRRNSRGASDGDGFTTDGFTSDGASSIGATSDGFTSDGASAMGSGTDASGSDRGSRAGRRSRRGSRGGLSRANSRMLKASGDDQSDGFTSGASSGGESMGSRGGGARRGSNRSAASPAKGMSRAERARASLNTTGSRRVIQDPGANPGANGRRGSRQVAEDDGQFSDGASSVSSFASQSTVASNAFSEQSSVSRQSRKKSRNVGGGGGEPAMSRAQRARASLNMGAGGGMITMQSRPEEDDDMMSVGGSEFSVESSEFGGGGGRKPRHRSAAASPSASKSPMGGNRRPRKSSAGSVGSMDSSAFGTEFTEDAVGSAGGSPSERGGVQVGMSRAERARASLNTTGSRRVIRGGGERLDIDREMGSGNKPRHRSLGQSGGDFGASVRSTSTIDSFEGGGGDERSMRGGYRRMDSSRSNTSTLLDMDDDGSPGGQQRMPRRHQSAAAMSRQASMRSTTSTQLTDDTVDEGGGGGGRGMNRQQSQGTMSVASEDSSMVSPVGGGAQARRQPRRREARKKEDEGDPIKVVV